jgi:CheY-like chemotaxis protein
MGNGARPRYESYRQNPSRLNTMETPNSIVSVGIVEDQRRTREGLCALIDGSEGFHCVGAWRSMEEALSAPHTSSQPQVILLDLGLPGMSGIDGIPRLREKWPGAAIVALTVYEDNDRVFEALCAPSRAAFAATKKPAGSRLPADSPPHIATLALPEYVAQWQRLPAYR